MTSIKNKIRSGQLTIGSWLTIPEISVAEIMCTAGFDWLTIDIEHSAIGIESIKKLIAAIQSKGLKAFVRVYANEEVIIKRVLDAGADGIIVPMIKTKSDVVKLLEHVYYPPKGKRGVGLSRAQAYGIGFEDYKRKLEEEIVIIAQIEHIDAIKNLEEIISFDEIDATLIGPYDLSASMGKPGEFELDEVKKVINTYDNLCDTKSKPKGAHVISSNSDFLKEKINNGYSFLAFSLDFFFLGDRAREEMKKIKIS